MLSEIGSNFWEYHIDKDIEGVPFFWGNSEYDVQYFKSGRNAIKALCRSIVTTDKRAMLPIYTCETVIQPFLDEGWSVSFYKINKDLTINSDDFMNVYSDVRPKVVFVHSFFGFNTLCDQSFQEICKTESTVLVEDMTQSLFSNHHIEIADYYVTSFRKFLAVPDGGALICRKKIPILNIADADTKIEKVALEAFNLKREYFINSSQNLKSKFREKYQELNCLIADNDSLKKISPISYKIISSCDVVAISALRRRNYMYIYEMLSAYSWIQPALNQVTDGVCPLYLPVYVDKRNELQSFLAKYSIYCPVIWPKPKQITALDADSQYMYEHMLCIPIDQRYGLEEMDSIRSAIEKFDYMEKKSNG